MHQPSHHRNPLSRDISRDHPARQSFQAAVMPRSIKVFDLVGPQEAFAASAETDGTFIKLAILAARDRRTVHACRITSLRVDSGFIPPGEHPDIYRHNWVETLVAITNRFTKIFGSTSRQLVQPRSASALSSLRQRNPAGRDLRHGHGSSRQRC